MFYSYDSMKRKTGIENTERISGDGSVGKLPAVQG